MLGKTCAKRLVQRLPSRAWRLRREFLRLPTNQNARGTVEKRADSQVACKAGLARPLLFVRFLLTEVQ